MNFTGADMMEEEASAPPQAWSSNSDPNDVVRNLLVMARQLVNQGKPSQALQAGGDRAVAQFLNRARELYKIKTQSLSAVDELASFFAECAIAEAMSPEAGQFQHKMDTVSIEPYA